MTFPAGANRWSWKKNKFWKATGPARSLIHFAQRQRDRLSHCGGPKDILRKIRNKSRQKSLMESYGTGSFPDAEQRKKEEETIFPYMPKISGLFNAEAHYVQHSGSAVEQ